MNTDPFFIVGSGRSGTTLLRMILASHSRISIPPETYFLMPLLQELPVDRALTRAEADRAVTIMTGHYRWPDMGIAADAFAQEVAAAPNPRLRTLVEIVYRKHLDREGKSRWGDKTPPYMRIVPELTKLFPEARFIHLVRDGRDVAKSFQSVGWYGPLLHNNTKEWREAMALDGRWRDMSLGDRLFAVRYEDLVRETEKTTRDICAFLGEAFEPQMLGWEEKVEQLVPQREMYIHEKLRRKPSLNDIERWRREMTPWERLVSEAFMGRDLKRAGYQRNFVGGLWAPVFAVVRINCLVVKPVLAKLGRAMRQGTAGKKPAVSGRGGA